MLLLASRSPRRSDLLARTGLDFAIEACSIEELSGPQWPPRELCLRNAELKAAATAARFPDDVVLGADTVVSLNGEAFGKPRDLAEATAMLEKLAGRVHEVLTGVCLHHGRSRKICRFVESSRVKFRPREMIDPASYLASINPLDKAGAYAAQEDEGRLIESIEGSQSNVIGLPVERVIEALRTHFPHLLATGSCSRP